MTFAEAVQWAKYIKKHGSLNIGRRLEWGFAAVAVQVNNGNGGKAKMHNFMPNHQPEETPATMEHVFDALKGMKREKRK